jgi:hypothetical protein
MANYIDPNFKPKDSTELTEELLLIESWFKQFDLPPTGDHLDVCDFKATNGDSKDV